MTDSHYKRTTCVHCNISLGHSFQAKTYCGNACKLAAWKAANPEKLKSRNARYQAKVGARPPTLCVVYAGYCESCRRPHVSKRKRRYCGRECELRVGREAALTAAQAEHRAAAKVIACEMCEASFCPLYGASHATLCAPCAEHRFKTAKRIAKLRRKAASRGVNAERVDPLKVFARDKWHCRICGVSTPASKRGTCDANAPELDHIIPVSKGGPHTYLNTQCACRTCNIKKSDKPLGQLLLIG